jgi:membrane-bound inhibitor of C-type lysozyme
LPRSFAFAAPRAGYSCDEGHKFTITFLQASNNQFARLVFTGSRRAIILQNQGLASGIAYAGGGFEYHQWHGWMSLKDTTSPAAKEIACHAR